MRSANVAPTDANPAQQNFPTAANNNNVGEPQFNRERELSKISIQSSFRDLVINNDQGQPSIDVNRMIYQPQNKKHTKVKEKLSWYLPDYIFVIFNFLCLTYSIYYVLNGVTLISWRNSMEPFSVTDCDENCDCKAEMNVEICYAINETYGDVDSNDKAPFTIIRFGFFDDVGIHGLCLLVAGLCNIVNIIIGISASLGGSKNLLVGHVLLDVILIIFEVVLVVILYLTGRCEDKDIQIIKLVLERLVNNYAKYPANILVKKDTTALDLLQISLTCCGVASWADFLPRSVWEEGRLISQAVSLRYTLDKVALIIPSSCCRQWWVRNIYCAHEAHSWLYPTVSELQAHQFRQRISQWGCLPKMVGLCRNMNAMAGVGGVVAFIFHFCLSIVRFICAYCQIQIMIILVRERRRIFRNRGASFGDNVAGVEDNDEGLISLTSILNAISSKVSTDVGSPENASQGNVQQGAYMPRESVAVASTQLIGWMNNGQAFVEGDNLNKENKSRQTYMQLEAPGEENNLNDDEDEKKSWTSDANWDNPLG